MVDPSASPRRRGTAVFAGLLGAGLLWVTATVVAALLAVGPVRSMACPSGGGFVHSDRVTLQVLPFGPTCRLEERDQLVDQRVDRRTRLDHHHHFARAR